MGIPDYIGAEKDRALHFYRGLTTLTEKDSKPLPMIDDTLGAFQGAEWFSTIFNLISGYWQVELTEEMKKSAFRIPGELYQFRIYMSVCL